MATLHLILDHLPDHDPAYLIEIEDDEGHSVSIGEWRTREDGLAELLLEVPDDAIQNWAVPPEPFLGLKIKPRSPSR